MLGSRQRPFKAGRHRKGRDRRAVGCNGSGVRQKREVQNPPRRCDRKKGPSMYLGQHAGPERMVMQIVD